MRLSDWRLVCGATHEVNTWPRMREPRHPPSIKAFAICLRFSMVNLYILVIVATITGFVKLAYSDFVATIN